ncbi:MAG TPA: DUF192 domain-containing protein [Acidimicrobiia bacterium]
MFPTDAVVVGDFDLEVWVADEPGERQQGLRGVTRLPADIDGMLFTFADPVSVSFVMEDTTIPLDLWFFDEDGALIGSEEMTPCSTEPCPRYPAPGPIAWALETPAGSFEFRPGDLLVTSP